MTAHVDLPVGLPATRSRPGRLAGAEHGRQQRALLGYFVLVLASVGLAALLLLRFPDLLPTPLILLLASWIPNLAGVAVSARTDGRARLGHLFGRVVRWRFGWWWWYAIAVLLPLAATLLAIGIGMLLG